LDLNELHTSYLDIIRDLASEPCRAKDSCISLNGFANNENLLCLTCKARKFLARGQVVDASAAAQDRTCEEQPLVGISLAQKNPLAPAVSATDGIVVEKVLHHGFPVEVSIAAARVYMRVKRARLYKATPEEKPAIQELVGEGMVIECRPDVWEVAAKRNCS